jgi:hypothetical protein
MKSPEELGRQADAWNVKHPIGTPVIVIRDDGSAVLTKTLSLAYVLGGHTAVIFIEGISSCYALDRVRPDPFRDAQQAPVPDVFTPEEVKHLWHHQFGPWRPTFGAEPDDPRPPHMHPYTCPNRGDGHHFDNGSDLGALIPTRRGWICTSCDYRQTTATDFMKGKRK